MKKLFEKIRLPFSILFMAMFIISVPAVAVSVYTGRESAISAINEQFSEINENSEVTVYDILLDSDSLCMPEKYLTEKAETLHTVTRKKYTEYNIATTNGSVTVRNYNYAYLTEDEPVKIPDDAKKITWDNIEIFIWQDKDNTATALYYNGLSRYIIKENCSAMELEKIFNKQP
ncbi:MAG: hypothetical protein IKM66_03275 [Clostridia bacterium]|nr:hypothetical protein [Clostridia bacterium]